LPTYEYACTACGHRLDAVQKFTDDALTECPDCGGKLRKVFGAPGIVLKGSGFYKTDTRAQDKRASSEKSGSNGSDSSGSDTKTEKTEKTESSTKSTDSGSKAEPSKSGSNGDKAVKESKPAASAAT
jgi:putative FmdB family regulatory protein